MAHYLVVAHQTATSPELMHRVSELASDDPQATFTVLVPATPVVHLLTWEEGETQTIAKNRADQAKALLKERGLQVEDAKVGDASPLLAIADELRTQPQHYDGIVLSTLPRKISRWLRLDVHNRAERAFGIPVIRVLSENTDKVKA